MKNTTWKKISRSVLLKHPRLTVVEDVVELPSNHRTTYIHFGKSNHAAQVIALSEEGKILVQREYSYPPNRWLYQFPGGAVETGESPKAGALRELAEEAGLTGSLHKIGWFYMDNRRRSSKLYVFTAQHLEVAIAKKDIEEDFESYWCTEEQIDAMISRGEIINYSMLAAWALYKASKSA